MISRRGLILSVLFIAATSRSYWTIKPSGVPTLDPERCSLAEVFSCKDSARALGIRYVAATPSEADAPALRRLVLARLCDSEAATNTSARPINLRQALRRKISEDFSAGDVIILDGWVMSRTECRVCALTALG